MRSATHSSRGSGSVFTSSRTFAGFQTPQTVSSRRRKTCGCVCTCTPTSWPKDWQQTTLGTNILPAITHKQALGKGSDKENQTEDSASPSKKQQRAYTKRRTIDEKLKDVLTCIDKAGWSLAAFVFYFLSQRWEGNFPHPYPCRCSPQVSHWTNGLCTHGHPRLVVSLPRWSS